MKTSIILFALLAVPCFLALRPGPSNDSEAVIHTTNLLYKGIEQQDTALLKTLFLEGSQFYASVASKEGPILQRFSSEHWIKGLVKPQTTLLERSWNPQVKVHRGIATVWSPYDFYIDGSFSHCGINAVSLVQTNGGWKIVNIVFSVEKECEDSPLGPVEG